jgi:Tn3 transposase DDE domain
VVTAATALWNTTYLDRAIQSLRWQGESVPDELLTHLAPVARRPTGTPWPRCSAPPTSPVRLSISDALTVPVRTDAVSRSTSSQCGWQHINLTGDYLWDADTRVGPDGFRPLRRAAQPLRAAA